MQHSSYITGVLAVVLMYLLGVFMISRCQNGAPPPPPPGGEEGVIHVQELSGLLMWSSDGVTHRQECECRVCEGAWCILRPQAGDILHVQKPHMLCYTVLAYHIHAIICIVICIVTAREPSRKYA